MQVTINQVLAKNGYSATKPRRIVFETLQIHGPVSMSDLVRMCSKQVNRASVYRIIDVFEKLHIVQRISFGWKYTLELGDMFKEHRHHASCEQCGTIFDLPHSERLESALSKTLQELGFTPHEHRVEVSGICNTCTSVLQPADTHTVQ